MLSFKGEKHKAKGGAKHRGEKSAHLTCLSDQRGEHWGQGSGDTSHFTSIVSQHRRQRDTSWSQSSKVQRERGTQESIKDD